MAVETPILQASPSMDAHVHGPKTRIQGPDGGVRDFYLHTSPEFAMKKLLVAGMENIYQICPVFRDRDSSARHSPEFTMLEFYRTQADYRAIMQDCIDAVRAVAKGALTHTGKTADPFAQWEFLTVAQAFDKYAGMSLVEVIDSDAAKFSAAAQKMGVRVTDSDSWADIFFAVMAEKIEPFLGIGAPCILYEYPAAMGSLARPCAHDPRFAERFEIYVCGLELANGFGEQTDAGALRARYESEMALMQAAYGYSFPPDEDFFKAMEYGLPPCAGVALGVDRLVMVLTGAETIDDVLWCGKP